MQLINIDLKDKKIISIILSTIFLIVFLINFVDIPLSIFVSSNIDTNNTIIVHFSYIGSLVPMVLVNFLFFIGYCLYNKKISIKIINFLSIQIILSFLLRFLKFLFGRARPYMLEIIGYKNTFTFFNVNYDYSSFPSGHSFSAWVLITLLFYFFKDFFNKYIYLKYFVYLYGILMSLSRILLNVHFLSDVLTGIFLGVSLTIFFIKKLYKMY